MTLTPGGNKRIFVSDIHMGDQRSMGPFPPHPHTYGWLRKNITNVTNFLSDQLQAQDVGEVVILGDLFDQWVIPTDLDPLVTLRNICDNPTNRGVIDNLKALAGSSRIKLSYVPGNHDLSACRGDIPIRKKFIEATFPGINFICEDDQPTGVYRTGKLAAEHGNMYCLFNAPDTWTASDSFLPLGYFISRLVAYRMAQTGQPENYLNILVKFIHELELKPGFVDEFFFAVADDAGLDKSDKINMKNITGYPAAITISDVGNKYKQLISDWDKNHDIIRSLAAVIGDTADLSWAAAKVYLVRPDINIVIFGHTHDHTMRKHYLLTDERDQQKVSLDFPCAAIYANTGTWIDSAHFCTYVETEMDEANQRHYVRVKAYPGNVVLHEGFVTL